MRTVRIFGVLVAIVGVAAVVVALAPAARGQTVRVQRPGADAIEILAGVQIGASVRDVDSADVSREKLGSQTGAVVDGVDSDGPAAKAGLKTGDVIVEYDGERVRSARHLTRLVRESSGNHAVKIAVMRDGKRTELTVTPTESRIGPRVFRFDGPALNQSLRGLRDWSREFRGDIGRDFSFDFMPPNVGLGIARGRLGVTVQELTPQLAEYFGVKDGVLVTSVNDDSPAKKAGMKAGDVITAVGGHSVVNTRDLLSELRDVEDGKDASIDVTRDRKTMTLKATLEGRSTRRPIGRGVR